MRRKIMAANGKACFSAYRPDLKRRAEPATREIVEAWVARRGKAGGYSMDGDAVTFEYVGSAETGQSAQEGICLCPTAEAQGIKKISPTLCWCSVGYVKEMHERVFGRPVNVELITSVLMGSPRCRFRITLA
jgi:predicted hydrocarbon binding protein